MGDELSALFQQFRYGFDRRVAAGNRLVAIGEPAVAYLLAQLREGAPAVRVRAAVALDEFESSPQRPAAVEGLLAALYDEHPPVRRRAARTLRHYRQPRMDSVLIRWLDSPDEADRTCARTCLSGLGATGDERLQEALRRPIRQARRPDPRPVPRLPVAAVPLASYLAGRTFPPDGPARHKTHQVLGYLPGPAGCVCARDWFTTPPTKDAAAAMAAHWSAIHPLRTLVTTDPQLRVRVWQCNRCGRFWAEDTVGSGQAELYFGYPIERPVAQMPASGGA